MNWERGSRRLVVVLSAGLFLLAGAFDVLVGPRHWVYRVTYVNGESREGAVGWAPWQRSPEEIASLIGGPMREIQPPRTEVRGGKKIVWDLEPVPAASVRTLWGRTLWSWAPTTPLAAVAVGALWLAWWALRWVVRGFVT